MTFVIFAPSGPSNTKDDQDNKFQVIFSSALVSEMSKPAHPNAALHYSLGRVVSNVGVGVVDSSIISPIHGVSKPALR